MSQKTFIKILLLLAVFMLLAFYCVSTAYRPKNGTIPSADRTQPFCDFHANLTTTHLLEEIQGGRKVFRLENAVGIKYGLIIGDQQVIFVSQAFFNSYGYYEVPAAKFLEELENFRNEKTAEYAISYAISNTIGEFELPDKRLTAKEVTDMFPSCP